MLMLVVTLTPCRFFGRGDFKTNFSVLFSVNLEPKKRAEKAPQSEAKKLIEFYYASPDHWNCTRAPLAEMMQRSAKGKAGVPHRASFPREPWPVTIFRIPSSRWTLVRLSPSLHLFFFLFSFREAGALCQRLRCDQENLTRRELKQLCLPLLICLNSFVHCTRSEWCFWGCYLKENGLHSC